MRYGYDVTLFTSVTENDRGEVVDIVDWQKFEKTLPKTMTLFVVEGTRGGETELHTINDICIDDFSVIDKACGGASTTTVIGHIVLTVHGVFAVVLH